MSQPRWQTRRPRRSAPRRPPCRRQTPRGSSRRSPPRPSAPCGPAAAGAAPARPHVPARRPGEAARHPGSPAHHRAAGARLRSALVELPLGYLVRLGARRAAKRARAERERACVLSSLMTGFESTASRIRRAEQWLRPCSGTPKVQKRSSERRYLWSAHRWAQQASVSACDAASARAALCSDSLLQQALACASAGWRMVQAERTLLQQPSATPVSVAVSLFTCRTLQGVSRDPRWCKLASSCSALDLKGRGRLRRMQATPVSTPSTSRWR